MQNKNIYWAIIFSGDVQRIQRQASKKRGAPRILARSDMKHSTQCHQTLLEKKVPLYWYITSVVSAYWKTATLTRRAKKSKGNQRANHYAPLIDPNTNICVFYLDWNCSRILTHVKQPCGLVSKTTCQGLGCCWNESEANSTLRCFNKK